MFIDYSPGLLLSSVLSAIILFIEFAGVTLIAMLVSS